jgi:hypothetical protein
MMMMIIVLEVIIKTMQVMIKETHLSLLKESMVNKASYDYRIGSCTTVEVVLSELMH